MLRFDLPVVVRAPRVEAPVVAGLAAAVIVVAAGLNSASSAHRLIQLGVGAILVFVAFRWLLAATVLFIILTFPTELPGWLGAGSTVAKPFGILLACSTLLLLIRERDRPVLFRDRPVIAGFLVAYLTWASLSLVWAVSSSSTVYDIKRLLQAGLLVAVVYSVVRTRREFLALCWAFVGASAIWSVYALSTGVAIAGGRLTGGVSDPNYLAAELVLGILLGGFLIGSTRRRAVQALGAGAALVDLVAFMLTQSRGGIIGLSLGLVVAIAIAGRARGAVVAVVAIALAISVGYFALVAPAQVRHRVTDYSTSHTSGRSDSWQIAWKIAQDHPIHGVALGGYRDAQLKYVASSIDVQYVGQILNDRLVVHNTYLETLAELGIVGFLFFGGTIVLALGMGLRTARQVEASDANALRGLVAGTCGMLAAFFFVSAEYEKPLWIAVALLAASPVVRRRAEPVR